ncbi:unnamed protein product [Albugo candida]|uniref:Uncharacterized protein n=1 Tax=Albugo candida TaxID=65357 RepID=A0A024GKG5_9STRA|nr:unnamed protein product [Albugo candida]|eukprot:CCI46999.1 unnamed protein product [Albugo candida]
MAVISILYWMKKDIQSHGLHPPFVCVQYSKLCKGKGEIRTSRGGGHLKPIDLSSMPRTSKQQRHMKAMRAAYETKKAGNISSSTIENRNDIKADLEVEFEDFEEEQTNTIIVSIETACKRPSRYLGDSNRTNRRKRAAQEKQLLVQES